MFIEKILIEYKKVFGFWSIFKKSTVINKFIWVYLAIYFLIAAFLTYSLISKDQIKILICILSYGVLYLFVSQQRKHRINKLDSDPFSIPGVEEFNAILKRINVSTEEEIVILKDIIDREICIIKERRKSPISNIISQLLISLLVSGILANAFIEIRNGNVEIGSTFLALYIGFIGIAIMVHGFYKTYQQFFGRLNYLMEICLYIELKRLMASFMNKQITYNNTYKYNDTDLPSRKIVHK